MREARYLSTTNRSRVSIRGQPCKKIKVVLLTSASEVHWRVQPTAARLSDRFNKMHVPRSAGICFSAMPPRELSANDWKWIMAISPTCRGGIVATGERCAKLARPNFKPSPEDINIKSRTGELRYGTIFHKFS